MKLKDISNLPTTDQSISLINYQSNITLANEEYKSG